MAIQTIPAPTAAPALTARRGFPVSICPKCGVDACIHVGLRDVNDLRCNECGEDFTLDEVRAFIECWTPILRWLALAGYGPSDG